MKKLLAITLWIALAPVVSQAASLMPQGKQAYHAANGAPLAGGKVYTYAAGTSTPLATYSDQAGATPNANPVVLDSRGEASIFWGAGPYKVTLRTSADALVWTTDNLYPPFTGGSVLALYNGGSASAPELTWADDTNTGLYRINEDNVGLSLGGTKRWDYAAAGSTLTGTLTVSGATTLSSTLAVAGATTLSSTLAVAGATTLTGALTGGAATFDSVTAGTLTVAHAATFDSVTAGTLTVAHAATFADPVTVGTATGSQHAATKAYVDTLVPSSLAYTVPALGANWSDTQGIRYRKVASGIVHFRGGVTAAAGAANPIFTLPFGYRTGSNNYWPVLEGNLGGTKYIQIQSTGAVNVVGGPTEGSIYYFDPVSFAAEN
jgi:hypothetical protein